MKSFIMTVAIVSVLSIISCSQWKLLKETGTQPVVKKSENHYLLSKEYYTELPPDARNLEYEKFRNEFTDILHYEQKADKGQRQLVDQCTTVKYYAADFENRWENTPKSKVLLSAEFTFDEVAFKRLVVKEKFASQSLKITGVGLDRVETLMASLAPSFNLLKGETELSFYTDTDLYVCPASRAKDILALILAVGKGEASFNDTQVSIIKEPSPYTEAVLKELINLTSVRRMSSLKGKLALLAPSSELIKTVETRISSSEKLAQAVNPDSTDLNQTVQNIYAAADLCSEGKAAEAFSRFCEKLRAGTFHIEVKHPDGNGYCNSGYAHPCNASAKGKDGLPISAEIRLEAVHGDCTVGANKQEYADLPASVAMVDGKTEFYINSFGGEGVSLKATLSVTDLPVKDEFFKTVYTSTIGSLMPSAVLPLKNISDIYYSVL